MHEAEMMRGVNVDEGRERLEAVAVLARRAIDAAIEALRTNRVETARNELRSAVVWLEMGDLEHAVD